MKIKELKRTVNVSWSPAERVPVMLAAGSAAQQVDASFSSTSQLELYALNLEDPGLDLELKASFQTQHKFHKLVWSGAGVIVGGCDGGLLEFYSADRLLQKAENPLLSSSNKHNNHVTALDINPYQKNLLASGASESEIFIWDLNNTGQPMAPGSKSQPLDHVQALAWNQQVQHILGSTFASRCVVWDLRKNEPIMKLSDSQSRSRWRALAWHPGVATQLCVASEDDQAPVVQLWDLRLAASPLATLEGHQKGVMALSWCRQDPDLLLSAGKDGRVLCWNPNNTKPGGELLVEVSQQEQWVFDVAWCARDPSLLVSSSFEQQVTVHSLLGGGGSARPESSGQNQSNILEAFGAASLGQLPAVARAAPPPAPRAVLPRAPKWLRTPVAAKFSFGGKLVTFEKCPDEANSQKMVYISQVVSEPEIVECAAELDAVLGSTLSQEPGALDALAEYCRQKGDAATDQSERYTWFFLRANFMPGFRSEVLNLLGFKQDEITSKFKAANNADQSDQFAMLSRGESTETEAELSTDTSTDLSDAHTLIERKLSNLELEPTAQNVVIPNGEDSTGLICRALVCGNLEEAVELCLEAKRVADALIIASLGSQELFYKVQKYHLSHTAKDPVSLIAGSLLQSQWQLLVQSAAATSWRDVLGALVTHCDGDALQHYCEMLGDRLSQEKDPALSEAATTCYLCAMSADALVARWAARRARGAAPLARLTGLALLARRAAAARGRHASGGKLDMVLTEYASRLAAQGCLQSALNSLEGVADNELRERLRHSLGLGQARRASHQPAPAQFGRTRTSSGPQKRGHLVAHNDVSNTYSAVPPSYDPNPWQAAPVTNTFQQPYTPPQPPRPGSVGPTAGGITSKSKYKVDPSVQSAPLYNQYSFNNPQPPSFGFNSPLPDQYSGATVPSAAFNQPNQFNPLNPSQLNQNPLNPNPLNSNPLNPNPLNPSQLNPLNPSQLNPMNPMNPSQLNPMNPSQLNPMNPSQLNPVAPPPSQVNGNYYQEPARQAAPGWNDPPLLTAKPKPKQEVQQQAPITHPLFGVEPPQHVPLNPQYPQQYPNQQFPGQYQQYPGQYDQHQGQYAPGTQYPQQTASPAPAPAPAVEAVPVQKAPIPDQHAVMQSVLDAIRAECLNRAANPQMKRKLEDVQRRLETLYDMLREYRLSESALSSLHTCVQYAQSSDYDNALHVTTSLATGADFAAVASFLPGLKSLFQMAAQLQVYAR
ncbi:COPII coat complex component secretory 31 [Choristoneura fumiferana]|uniref:COPII coat complex component secretory 31 n=1 Tax=Choristoneura fumiferana TaxID=7141 RepID=UPI003D155E5B